MKQQTWYLRIPIPWTRYSLELSLRRAWTQAEAEAFAETLHAPGATPEIVALMRDGKATFVPKRDPGGPLPTIKAERSQVPKP